MTVAPTSVNPHEGQHRLRSLLVAILAAVAGGVVVAVLYQTDVIGGSSSTTSGTVGSGVPATQARAVGAFDSVDLAGGNNVAIHVGGKRAVVVKGDDNLLARVTTKVESGTLVIGNAPGGLQARTTMSVDVTVPRLTALTLSGGGNVVVTGLRAERLTVTLSGSGNVTATGTAASLGVTLDGSGNVWLAGVTARDVHAVLGGSGTILVTATESLDASVPGSGSIVYAGNPRDVTKTVTGSGMVIAR